MKLAILGAIAVAIGFGTDTDGLIYAGALWVVGGVIMRLVVGSPKDLKRLDARTAGFGDVFGGKRGAGTVLTILVGGASVVLGVLAVGFETDDPWRWAPVAVGGVLAGMQILALIMFSAGSGLQSLIGVAGNPQHPAQITLDAVRETGVRINDRPRLELDLTVRPDGAAAYETTVKHVIGHGELGSLRPGTTYQGLVDLEVPEGVDIDWYQPIETGATVETSDISARLTRIDTLLAEGVITGDEHAEARRDILDDL